MAGPFGDRRVVGQFEARHGAVGGQQQGVVEGLRRLHGAQARPIRRAGHAARAIHRLDRVGDRETRDGRAVRPGGGAGSGN